MPIDHFAEQTARRPSNGAGAVIRNVVDGLLLRACAFALPRSPAGRLRITMPSGRYAVFGTADRNVEATIAFDAYAGLWQSMRRGSLGFAESYMAGDVRTDSLHALFNHYFENERVLSLANRRLQRSSLRDRLNHVRRANTLAGSRRNISDHYDLGNDFYRLWLDAGMTYSSGIYESPSATLDAAQAAKYASILEALDLDAGQTLLEIGCGWGGLAEAAAARGCAVTGITISHEQFEAAGARVTRQALAGSAQIRFQDYRDTKGQYDRLASVEMIEAVGEDNWPAYFRVICDRLKPGGAAVLQAITIRSDLYDVYRRNPDFIQRYIFPGGMLPTLELMRRHGEAAGLTFEVVQTFGASYARTLSDWRARFEAAWPRIEALGFDARFRRMWNYYLTYCEVGFERGTIDVGLYRLLKPR